MSEDTTLPIIPSYRLGLQSLCLKTPWLIVKLWDWMLEWQCAKVTPSVKQHFEMERNHGRLSKTGLERDQPPPPELHMLAIVFRKMFYGTSLLGTFSFFPQLEVASIKHIGVIKCKTYN